MEVAQARRSEAHVRRDAGEGLGEAVREGDVHELLPAPDGRRRREDVHDEQRRDEETGWLSAHRRVEEVARTFVVVPSAALVALQLRAHAEDHVGTREQAGAGEPLAAFLRRVRVLLGLIKTVKRSVEVVLVDCVPGEKLKAKGD